MNTPYVELQLHSNFSFLNGASHIQELVEQAANFEYPLLALTDHNNLCGAMIFAQSCKNAGLAPIIGIELAVEGRDNLVLLAESRQGYANLCRLSSIAHGHSLPTQEERDVRRKQPYLLIDELEAHTAGLVCLARDQEDAERLVGWFGRENFFLTLGHNLTYGERDHNLANVDLAARLGIDVVATGDVYYHVRDRHRLHDAMVAVRTHTTMDGAHRARLPNSEYFLREPRAQVRRFQEFPQAVGNALSLAERCSAFDLNQDLGYHLPSPPVPEGMTPDGYLEVLCRSAVDDHYSVTERAGANVRLDEEMRLVRFHGMAGFFLIYNEVFQLAREVGAEVRGNAPRASANLPPGRGRGSSVGSIVCYLIGLSHIDPVRNNLFLGRFLNEEMVGLPDIDLDFPRDIRARLFERVYERWGTDHAAIVATYPTYKIRSAVRDLGKAIGLPEREVDRLAKFAGGWGSAREVKMEMERSPRLAALVDTPGWRELIDLAGQLAEMPRHLSQHVGGVVISSDPLIDCVPIIPAAWPGRYICQWDKDGVEDARMVKIDFLALGMLSLVEECVNHVAEERGETPDLSRIDFEDQRVYDRICIGDTVGVFQIESRAQSSMLVRSQPRNLDDLAAQVAIVRPGPIVGGAVHPYLERRELLRKDKNFVPPVPHESLHPVLDETLGVIIYQEQVVQVSMLAAGFSAGEAEGFRRALGRRNWEQNKAHYREKFMAGTAARGIDAVTAEGLFGNLCGFAEFGFPKSHSVAFGLLAYQSAWLKEYYPPEFYCALFNNWPMGFYPPHVVTGDAKRHGVDVLPPDINLSQAKCTVEKGQVRIGLGYVKAVGQKTALLLESERANGEFKSLFNLIHRIDLSRLATENLIRAGAFRSFGLGGRELLWQLGLLADPDSQQTTLELPTEQDQVELIDFSEVEQVVTDYELIGLSTRAHPMGLMRGQLPKQIYPSGNLRQLVKGTWVEVAGMTVCRQQPGTAKGTVFLTVEDECGLMNVVVPPKLYEASRTVVRSEPFLSIKAVVEGHAGDVAMLKAIAISPLGATLRLDGDYARSWT